MRAHVNPRTDYYKLSQQDLFTGEVDRVQVRPSLGTAAWLVMKPGWIRETVKRLSRRLTDHQFLVLLARRQGIPPPHDYQAGRAGRINPRRGLLRFLEVR